MKSKSYAVIGLGKFGFYVAKGLIEQGANVIAIDHSMERVKEVKELTDSVYVLDSTDAHALKEAGITGFDVVIVSIGENIEASILTVMALKDLGNKIVIAKAVTPIHGEILAKIGAFKVIYPERESAKKLVRDFIANPTFEVVDVTNTIKVGKVLASGSLVGKSLREIEVEQERNIRIMACKHQGRWEKNPTSDYVVSQGDMLILLGELKHIEGFYYSWGS